MKIFLFLSGFIIQTSLITSEDYVVDDSEGVGRRFDGIGGISGGGATSKLLINYPEPQRSGILDYLFKPHFGASLQILKVEIGGDTQSSDGSESSHMHESWDENYQRGYEWWLMKEAKKRNPAIKLYGLPWGFPGWVGGDTLSPYTYPNVTATYISKWIQGAKKYHNLTIDYVGIWNEKMPDVRYIKTLRSVLDRMQLSHVQIVAADLLFDQWAIVDDILQDKELNQVVDYIGVHYPGTWSPDRAISCNKTLWSSEDFSTYNDNTGAGCLARILNQNYVNGYMTSTIGWNLIASFYNNLPFNRTGFMTANQPWSGYYSVASPIWMTAHTTQFTEIGWSYLKHGAGVGKLKYGGSYVTLISPDHKDVTIIIETMSWLHSRCIRPEIIRYETRPQTVQLILKGVLEDITTMEMWYSKLQFNGQPSDLFEHKGPVKVSNGIVSLNVDVDVVITLTTLKSGMKGTHGSPPNSRKFPFPYKDTFEGYRASVEPYNLASQVGMFEVVPSGERDHGNVLQQVMTRQPISWCMIVSLLQPIAVIGDYQWSDLDVSVNIKVPRVNGTQGVFVAVHVDQGGCYTVVAKGLYFWLFPAKQTYAVTADLTQTMMLEEKHLAVEFDTWYSVAVRIKGNILTAMVDNKQVTSLSIPDSPRIPKHGFVGLGCSDFGTAYYDDLIIS